MGKSFRCLCGTLSKCPCRLSESKVRGGPDPDFSRIYRTDRGIDVVRSVPSAVDRVEAFDFHNTLTEFREIFDGSERIVSIAVEPCSTRKTRLNTDHGRFATPDEMSNGIVKVARTCTSST
jgi:hypothetical protein